MYTAREENALHFLHLDAHEAYKALRAQLLELPKHIPNNKEESLEMCVVIIQSTHIQQLINHRVKCVRITFPLRFLVKEEKIFSSPLIKNAYKKVRQTLFNLLNDGPMDDFMYTLYQYLTSLQLYYYNETIQVLPKKCLVETISCPICISDIPKIHMTETNCKHSYCVSCWKTWNNPVCPMCRTRVSNTIIYSYKHNKINKYK